MWAALKQPSQEWGTHNAPPHTPRHPSATRRPPIREEGRKGENPPSFLRLYFGRALFPFWWNRPIRRFRRVLPFLDPRLFCQLEQTITIGTAATTAAWWSRPFFLVKPARWNDSFLAHFAGRFSLLFLLELSSVRCLVFRRRFRQLARRLSCLVYSFPPLSPLVSPPVSVRPRRPLSRVPWLALCFPVSLAGSRQRPTPPLFG